MYAIDKRLGTETQRDYEKFKAMLPKDINTQVDFEKFILRLLYGPKRF